MVASGIWTWSRLWAALPFTFATIKAAMKAAKEPKAGVRQVMATIWGDEGNECELYSALPGIWYHAEQAYTAAEEVDAELLRLKFDGCAGGNFDDYIFASKLDDTQPEAQVITTTTHYTPNMSKYLLWEGMPAPPLCDAPTPAVLTFLRHSPPPHHSHPQNHSSASSRPSTAATTSRHTTRTSRPTSSKPPRPSSRR